ncbi:MAG: hypothetical protein D6689_10155, partial [Deltaproteobacteria bacterium]
AWCLDNCDPLNPTSCTGDNEACYIEEKADDGGVCIRKVDDLPAGSDCMFTNDCTNGTQCLGGKCRTLCGTITQMWNQDAMMQLTWPNCCGSNCTAADKPCPGLNEICWLIGSSDGQGVLEYVGFCETDSDASNTDGTGLDWTCDCANPAANGEVCQEVPGTGGN